MKLPTLLGIFLILYSTSCAPLKEETNITKRSINSNGQFNQITPGNVKKDVFISRGWGAGGMPFSVLYMAPHSSKAPMEHNYKSTQVVPKPKVFYKPKTSQISVRNSMGSTMSRTGTRKSYSIIPQLFVSYGWGPAGK